MDAQRAAADNNSHNNEQQEREREMAPKQQQHHEEAAEVSEERKEALKQMLIDHGLETTSLQNRDFAFLDEGVSRGYKFPKNTELLEMKKQDMADNKHHYAHLTTYLMHDLRSFIGKPVVPKGHHKESA